MQQQQEMKKKEEIVVTRSSERQKVIVRTLGVSCSSDLEQYENALPSRNASVWKVIVHEDHGAQYNALGAKVTYVRLMIVWRGDGGELRRKCIVDFNETDVLKLWRYHFGHFEGVTHILRISDSPHFRSRNMRISDSGPHFHADKRTGAAEADIVD